MATQWHPLFARLLRPLLEEFYEVQASVPVGDAPRQADILLLRRRRRERPPFQGLWRYLSTWNILELKGPTDTARVRHLDALMELGLGVDRQLQEERARQNRSALARDEVSFWYLANHLGRRFLREAESLVPDLAGVGEGVWGGTVLGRPLTLVSNQDAPVERDTLPIHVLVPEPVEWTRAVMEELAVQRDRWAFYAAWLAVRFPQLWEEVKQMARRANQGPTLDLPPVVDYLGIDEVIRQIGFKRLIEEMGLKRVVDEVGVNRLASELTPKQRRELMKALQKEE
jgi:hypothetical protein